jgi:hypothetical protein
LLIQLITPLWFLNILNNTIAILNAASIRWCFRHWEVVPAAEHLFFSDGSRYYRLLSVEEASEPKRSELFKKRPPNETDAIASGPNEPDALASGRKNPTL